MLGKKDNRKEDDDMFGGGDNEGKNPSNKTNMLGGDPKIRTLSFEMRVKNQVIYVAPDVGQVYQVGFFFYN